MIGVGKRDAVQGCIDIQIDRGRCVRGGKDIIELNVGVRTRYGIAGPTRPGVPVAATVNVP